ncbi:Stage III sporulation protein AD [Candidatus Hydrogenisulfobacillus filiaventi]|uniref:Stage III sporulation protein AD n=1 Tax=Candidatus Hydrogenisulfobacillus filiaventi TaxID=2707344 RepID=A0A6F8ZGW5_9FIRM|nr:stage III sporulation protein AD [Bacillota bacterium]CAB1128913.1 Stage III sporulation protein AD [Candidatus Hydrogenisulfobacillus filiaventi]
MAAAFQAVGIGLISTVLLLLLRRERPEWGVVVALAAGVALLFLVLVPLGRVVGTLTQLAGLGHLQGAYLTLLLKVLGIAYLTTLAAQVARDAGETLVAGRVELAGKVLILALALPIIRAITETLIHWLPT